MARAADDAKSKTYRTAAPDEVLIGLHRTRCVAGAGSSQSSNCTRGVDSESCLILRYSRRVLRIRRLFESALIRIDRIDHPPDASHVDPDEEISQQHSINVLERGAFSVGGRGALQRVTPADLFITAPGQVYRYVHDEHDAAPCDVCIAVCFTDLSRDGIDALFVPLVPRSPVLASNNRRAYLRSRLIAHLAACDDPIALDTVAVEFLSAAYDEGASRLYRPAQLAWYGRRVDGARRRLDEDFVSEHSLAALGRDAGMSPFHFARVFRELTGVPPHRYLLRRRLAAAADRLRAGASVTDACYAAGFRSLSHFIHAFRRQYGVSPSRFNAGRDTTSS